jgi:hypothetical protein
MTFNNELSLHKAPRIMHMKLLHNLALSVDSSMLRLKSPLACFVTKVARERGHVPSDKGGGSTFFWTR